MQLKWKQKFVAFVLVVLMVFLIQPAAISANSSKDYDKEIKNLEEEQRDIQSKKGSLEKNKESTQTKMDKNASERAKLEKELEKLDKERTKTEKNITNQEEAITKTNKEIKQLNKEIKQLNKEIIELENKIEERQELISERFVAIQRNGGHVSYSDVLLGSETINDFFSRAHSINVIVDSDQNIMKQLEEDQKELESKKTSVEKKKTSVEAKKKQLEEKKQALEKTKTKLNQQKQARDKVVKKLKKEYEQLENYQVSLEDEQEILSKQEEALKEAIKQAEAEQAEQKRKEEEAKRAAEAKQASKSKSTQTSSSNGSGQASPPASNQSVDGGGLFAWPSSGRMSSGFGPRWGTFHSGIDLAVGVGTPVSAAAQGVVIDTSTEHDGRMNGYGNVILVAHSINGKSYTTLYAHLQSISVSEGDSVGRGQVIGTSGNTGQSTGPHLHFEIHAGGWNGAKSNAVNPLSLLK